MSWHDLIISAPEFPQARLTPAQRRGLRYQARVTKHMHLEAKLLGDTLGTQLTLYSDLWFVDPLTQSPCSPDLLLEDATENLLCLIEVKLTQVDCTSQFSKYRRALQLPQLPCVQVCRQLRSPSTMARLADFHHGGLMLAYL